MSDNLGFYDRPYPVIIERGKDVWGIIVLGLDGCTGASETLDGALGSLNDIVDEYIEVLEELDRPIPDPPPGPVFVKIVHEDYFDDWDETLEYDTWIKVPEAARLLGCSANTVKTFIKDGRIPAYQPGRDYLLRTSEVMKFIIDSRTLKPTGSTPKEKVA